MNNVYTHNYKEVEVMDDKGNIRKVDYSDNIGEILECENAIETLECQIEETKDYLNKNYKYGSVNKLKLYIPTIINGCPWALILPWSRNTQILIISAALISLRSTPAARTILLPVNSSAPAITTRLSATLNDAAMMILAYGCPVSSPPTVKASMTPTPMNAPAVIAETKYAHGRSLNSFHLPSDPAVMAWYSSLNMLFSPCFIYKRRFCRFPQCLT